MKRFNKIIATASNKRKPQRQNKTKCKDKNKLKTTDVIKKINNKGP